MLNTCGSQCDDTEALSFSLYRKAHPDKGGDVEALVCCEAVQNRTEELNEQFCCNPVASHVFFLKLAILVRCFPTKGTDV